MARYLSDNEGRRNEPDLKKMEEILALVRMCTPVKLTPNRVACDGLSSRNLPKRSIGDHTASP